MKPLDLELLRAHLESCDWSSLHDAVYSALYQLGQAPIGRHLDPTLLVQVLDRLPEHIRTAGLKWGFGDSVIADNIVRHIRDNSKQAGSFEAWLQPAVE